MADDEQRSNVVRGDQLRGYVERIERLESDKQVVADDIKVVFAEAKANGYTSKYIRAVVKLRRQSPSEREENSAMLDLYMASMGMATETPLFRHLQGMGTDALARDSVIEALKLLAPEDGEFTVKIGDGARMRIWRDKEGVHAEPVPDAPAATSQSTFDVAQSKTTRRPGADAPDCTEDEAFSLGQQARRDDKPVIANPFAWDDKRRQRWDEGWRHEDGGDGMGPK